MLSYPSGMTVSSRGARHAVRWAHRNQRATRWRKLTAGRQALLVVAYLRKGETYADLACGFQVGTSTVYRYIREALELLAAMAPTLAQAIKVASRKAFVILDGTLLRIDRVGIASGYDRAFYSGKHKARRRGPGERVNAELKNWRILRKIRSSPSRAPELIAAVQTLVIADA